MMEEAERLCQRIAIIDLGKIVAEGTPDDLKKQVGGDVVNIVIGGEDGHVNGLEGALKSLNEREYVEAVTVSDGTLSVRVKDGGAAAPDLLRLLNEQHVAATNLSVISPTPGRRIPGAHWPFDQGGRCKRGRRRGRSPPIAWTEEEVT